MSRAWIDGKPVTLQAASAEAARLLAASRLPLVAGLGADIAGARAAIALAERIGGVVDHMNSAALLRDIDVMRETGTLVTTPLEARARADVLLLVGPGLAEAWPDLAARLLAPPARVEGTGQRRVAWLCPAKGAGALATSGAEVQTLGRKPEELPVLLASLRARAGGRGLGATQVPVKSLDAIVEVLRGARFGVAVWSAGDLDELAIAMLCGLVADLNAATRFTGLPLGPGDNATGVAEACGWMTGFPVRTAFARGYPEHDPWRFDGVRLVESGEADCVLWISSYRATTPAWRRAVPTVALTPEAARLARPARVQVAVGCPGRDHDGVEHIAATGMLGRIAASRPSDMPSVADVLGMISADLPGTSPC
jgi:formylmethanofuran dehydrogenase subunit B